jgi:hypothetical protein
MPEIRKENVCPRVPSIISFRITDKEKKHTATLIVINTIEELGEG